MMMKYTSTLRVAVSGTDSVRSLSVADVANKKQVTGHISLPRLITTA